MWTREVCINYISCTELWYHSHIFIQNWNKVAPCSKVHQIPFGVLEFYCTCLYSEIFSSWNWRELLLSRIGGCQGERYASITFLFVCIELWYHLHTFIQNWSKVTPCSKVHQIPFGVVLETYCTCLLAKFCTVEVDLSYLILSRIGCCQGERYASIIFFCTELWYHLHIFIQNWSKVAPCKVCQIPSGMVLESYCICVYSKLFSSSSWLELLFYPELEGVNQRGMHQLHFLHKTMVSLAYFYPKLEQSGPMQQGTSDSFWCGIRILLYLSV